jgi:hypothetical protein
MASVALGLVVFELTGTVREARPFRRVDRVAWAALLLLVSWQVQRRVFDPGGRWWDAGTALAGLDLAFLAVVTYSLWRAHPRAVGVALAVLAAVSVPLAAGSLAARWHAGLGPHFGRHFGCPFLDAWGCDRTPTPVCVLGERPYPFFGSRRQHRVLNPRLPPSPARMTPTTPTTSAGWSRSWSGCGRATTWSWATASAAASSRVPCPGCTATSATPC